MAAMEAAKENVAPRDEFEKSLAASWDLSAERKTLRLSLETCGRRVRNKASARVQGCSCLGARRAEAE